MVHGACSISSQATGCKLDSVFLVDRDLGPYFSPTAFLSHTPVAVAEPVAAVFQDAMSNNVALSPWRGHLVQRKGLTNHF